MSTRSQDEWWANGKRFPKVKWIRIEDWSQRWRRWYIPDSKSEVDVRCGCPMHKWTLMKEIEVRSKASDTANNLTDISQWCSKNRWHGDELTVVVGMSRPSVKWYYVCWRLDWSIEDWRHKVRVTTQLIWVNMTDMSQSRREVKWCDHRLIVVVTLSRPSVYENKICCRSGCSQSKTGDTKSESNTYIARVWSMSTIHCEGETPVDWNILQPVERERESTCLAS